jgi:hypothetical protein
MSPAGGVGINLAIQDAVAAANLLTDALRDERVTEELLACVQRRREFPTRVIQWLQVRAHQAFQYVFRHSGPIEAPWQLKLAARIPGRPHLMARLIGVGVRPEHIRDPQTRSSDEMSLKRIAVLTGVVLGLAVSVGRILRNAAK